jgi:GT2 family glycosyltransferase
MPQLGPLDISVVIVNFNGAAFIMECLDALFNSRLTYTYEVILVDNASTDRSFEVMEPYLHRMTIIKNTENTGFAFANNQGFKVAKGRYLFLLNTDAVVSPDAIQLMMDEHERFPDIGAIAPKLLNGDGSLQCPGSSFGHFRFKRNRRCTVPFIAGAAVLIRKSMMDAMNGMDENLFFYNDNLFHHESVSYIGLILCRVQCMVLDKSTVGFQIEQSGCIGAIHS